MKHLLELLATMYFVEALCFVHSMLFYAMGSIHWATFFLACGLLWFYICNDVFPKE